MRTKEQMSLTRAVERKMMEITMMETLMMRSSKSQTTFKKWS